MAIETQADVDSILGGEDREGAPLVVCIMCGALYLTVQFVPGHIGMCHCGSSTRDISDDEAGALEEYLRDRRGAHLPPDDDREGY